MGSSPVRIDSALRDVGRLYVETAPFIYYIEENSTYITRMDQIMAAQLRARYELKTPDALHVAAALEARCEAFLTNDKGIQRVTDLRVLVLEDLELDPPPTGTNTSVTTP